MKRLLIILSFFPLFILAQGPTANFTATSSCYGECTYFTDSSTLAWASTMAIDDMHDAIVSIGFNFDFYGTTYNQCVISGNGYITFDSTQANLYSPWSINQAIPNPGQMPENAIMAPWQDINTGVVGNIFYGTTGVPPNRMFIVIWHEVAMFSCTNLLHTSQVVMHEGSNKIEMFIQDKPLCLTWNAGAAVQGLVDATSTNFDIVDDPILLSPRNWPLAWTSTNEGWEFLPNTTNGYIINQITYTPILGVTSSIINWQWDMGGTGNYVNGTDSTSQNPIFCYDTSGTYNVFLIVTDDNGLVDTTNNLVVVNCPPLADFMSDIVCEGECTSFTDLSSILIPMGGLIANWDWDMGGSGTYSFGTSSISQTPMFCYDNCGSYIASLIVTDDNGCHDTIYQVVEVLCNPIANFFLSPGDTCVGDTICFTNASVNGGDPIVAFDWDFGDGGSSSINSPCYIYTNAGIYIVTLTITDSSGCSDTYTQSIFIDSCNTSTVLNNYTTSRKLLKVTDILGRETKKQTNILLIEIYDDGTVEKKIIIE